MGKQKPVLHGPCKIQIKSSIQKTNKKIFITFYFEESKNREPVTQFIELLSLLVYTYKFTHV